MIRLIIINLIDSSIDGSIGSSIDSAIDSNIPFDVKLMELENKIVYEKIPDIPTNLERDIDIQISKRAKTTMDSSTEKTFDNYIDYSSESIEDETHVFSDTSDQKNSEPDETFSEDLIDTQSLLNNDKDASPFIKAMLSSEKEEHALQQLGFDSVCLKELGFTVHFLVHQSTNQHGKFIQRSLLCNWLVLGASNALVISKHPHLGIILVCGILAHEPTMEKQKNKYGQILIRIKHYCRQQKRGKGIQHPMKGKMYAHGYRGDRLGPLFSEYYPPVKTSTCSIKCTKREREVYLKELTTICEHKSRLLEIYFPLQAKQALDLKETFHTPSIGKSNAGNYTVTHNFQSAAHNDPDASFAIGAWYDVGKEKVEGGEFAFPEYRMAVKLHHGIVLVWHSAYVMHATLECNSQQCVRVGTSMQLGKRLCTKALKIWQESKNSAVE